MKNQIFLFIRSAMFAVFACILGSAAMLLSCEPEALEGQPLEMTLDASAAIKGSPANLPHKEIAQLRAAVAPWHKFETALAAGYELDVTGYVNQMGHHYLNVSLLDDEFEVTQPELLLFVPAPNGKWRFVGVEYAVPIADMENPQPAPEGFPGDADHWVINTEFNLWTLHVWVGLHNPDGIFAMHNPRLP